LDNQDLRFVRNPDFIFRKIVEETILVPVYQDVADMDAIYSLNELGAFIWECLATPVEMSKLEGNILDAFNADPSTVSEDLIHFLDDMEAIGAITRVEA
jgi:hypothetical protein